MDRVKKFGKLSIDQKTGQGTLEVVAKRIMSDDVDLIIEVLKRYTEGTRKTFRAPMLVKSIKQRLPAGHILLCYLQY